MPPSTPVYLHPGSPQPPRSRRAYYLSLILAGIAGNVAIVAGEFNPDGRSVVVLTCLPPSSPSATRCSTASHLNPTNYDRVSIFLKHLSFRAISAHWVVTLSHRLTSGSQSDGASQGHDGVVIRAALIVTKVMDLTKPIDELACSLTGRMEKQSAPWNLHKEYHS